VAAAVAHLDGSAAGYQILQHQPGAADATADQDGQAGAKAVGIDMEAVEGALSHDLVNKAAGIGLTE
jgi:hypothetical protein